jgi:hypothetical protein
MESREEFNLLLQELGFGKVKKLICDEFYTKRNLNLAKRQHYWLKQKYPRECTKQFFENLFKIGLYEDSLIELRRI